MAIAKGDLIGPYEILAHIGAGGMGDVWRARDRRIRRDVAIKILPDAYGDGDERIQRFEQEARAAGALNHPGLVTIFDVGRTDGGAPYIVMELLEGETLRDIIGRVTPTPVPIRKAVDYATQIAAALAVAHEKGIIHRDLKPENVFVTNEARVKILDFGLAKLAEVASGADSERNRTARHLTSAGMVVGTPGYMSPEQVRAQPLDHRTDIFSLGTLMYEMLCARSPFESESAVETMHAVLNVEPPMLSALAPTVPPALETIVRHCMEKNPRDRFQSARDLAFQLRMVADGDTRTTTTRATVRAPKSRRAYGVLAGALLLVSAAAAGGFVLHRAMGAQAADDMQRTFRQLTFGDGLEMFPALAPDAKSFAYVSSQTGNRDIYVQRVDGRTAINITSDSPDDDSEPAFSPDGSQIAFRSERDGGGIFVMGVTGESVRRLTDRGHNPSWSPDGTRIVYATSGVELRPHARPETSELWIVDARTGARKPLVQPRVGGPDFGRQSDAVQPSWSPHGKRIAFWGLSTWFAQRDIWTIDPDDPQPKKSVVRVTTDSALHWNPVWSPDGKYLYYGSDRDGTLNLWRVPMDEETGKPTGPAEPLSLPASVTGNFAFSQNGDMAFVTVTRSYRLMAMPFDSTTAQTGTPQQLFGGTEEILTFQPSPDGKQIAYTTGGGVQEDVFVADANGSRVRQLTNDAAKDRSVTWSPDGKSLYFYSNRDGTGYTTWMIRADGSGLTRVVDATDLRRHGINNLYIPTVSPDGKTIALQSEKANALIHLEAPRDRRVEPIAMNVTAPKWSPDGTRLVGAYDTQTLSGQNAGITVYSIPERRAQEVYPTGVLPQFLPDGHRIVFFDRDHVNILDLDTKNVTRSPLAPFPGTRIDVDSALPVFSKDGTTLFLRQIHEFGDIWLVRPASQK